MANEGTLRLSRGLRLKLKKPLGVLKEEMMDVNAKNLVCVGDVVSENAIECGFSPKICVFDGRCKREDIGVSEVIGDYKAVQVEVVIPAGVLTQEALAIMEEAFARNGNTKIRVNGEEDLFTLLAIHYAPNGWTVVYGQPDEGVVEVTVNDKTKETVDKILEEMEDGL